MEGTKNGLAYLGSANFTAHGWGFLGNQMAANVEAGLIIRRSLQTGIFDPDPRSYWHTHSSSPVATSSRFKPPSTALKTNHGRNSFGRCLSPAGLDDNELELIEVGPEGSPLAWSAKLLDKEGSPARLSSASRPRTEVQRNPSVYRLSVTNADTLIDRPGNPDLLERLPHGRAVPLNVEASARMRLPISPAQRRIQETDLLSITRAGFHGKNSSQIPTYLRGNQTLRALPRDPSSGVDKSRIQSYQIREFVEALNGISQDLAASTQSEPSMRLALLGPVSPLALAHTVSDAVCSGCRSPMAAAFNWSKFLYVSSRLDLSGSGKAPQAWEEPYGRRRVKSLVLQTARRIA